MACYPPCCKPAKCCAKGLSLHHLSTRLHPSLSFSSSCQSCYLYHLATTPCGISQHLCNLAPSIQHVSVPPTVSRCTESIAFRVLSASSSIGLWIGYVYVSKIILVLHPLYALAFQIRRARMLCLLRWRRTVHLEWLFPKLCHGRYHTPS